MNYIDKYVTIVAACKLRDKLTNDNPNVFIWCGVTPENEITLFSDKSIIYPTIFIDEGREFLVNYSKRKIHV